MNLLLQQGICLSPPLIGKSLKYNVTHIHRDHPICEKVEFAHKPPYIPVRSVKELGFFEEMHIFEYFDWTNTISYDLLKKQHDERLERIGHCEVDFDKEEYRVIMKEAKEMLNSGWSRHK